MPPCNRADRHAGLRALGDDRRLLFRRPDPPAARSGEHLKPPDRLRHRLKLSDRHMSKPQIRPQTSPPHRPSGRWQQNSAYDLLLARRGKGRDRNLAAALQRCSPALGARLQAARAGGRAMAGCATPPSSAGHTNRRISAGHELTLQPDHSRGAGQSQPFCRRQARRSHPRRNGRRTLHIFQASMPIFSPATRM